MMIKSCPCCGSNNVKFTVRKASDKEYGYVSCDDCKLTQGETSVREKSEAIKLWNTRPSWDKLKEEVEKKKMYYKNGSTESYAAEVYGTEYYGNVLKMMYELETPNSGFDEWLKEDIDD